MDFSAPIKTKLSHLRVVPLQKDANASYSSNVARLDKPKISEV